MTRAALDTAIDLLTDGHAVEWERLLAEAESPEEREAIHDLRVVSQVGEYQIVAPSIASDETVGVPAPAAAHPRQRWGQLEILEEIGRGSQGVVYRAWDTRLAREVAVKLNVDLEASASSLNEARRLARVTHPHVVAVYGADRLSGQVGIWMELLRGRTLDQILRDQGPYSVRETIGIGVEICGALAAIHRAGLVHRDIKAQNVIRELGGRLVVMDLGASLDSVPDGKPVQALAGTPLYMAPELFEGSPASVSSDVYALGVLLYRLITAAFPIDAQTIGDVRRAHAAGRLRQLRDMRPDLQADFVAVVTRCLSVDPERRFPNAAALEHALLGLVGTTSEPATSQRPHAGWLTMTGLVMIGVVATTAIVTLWPGLISRRAGTLVTEPRITPDQYAVLSAYEELALTSLAEPQKALRALVSAIALVRSSMPGQHPWFTLLHARLVDGNRRSGDLAQARASANDAAAHAFGSGTMHHPYTAVLAMELARNAQAAADHAIVATEVLRALDIRSRMLALDELATGPRTSLDAAALAAASRRASLSIDTDRDGILDLIEVAAGLNPLASDSDRDGTEDGDDDRDGDGVANRLELGLLASPLLTWAHAGAHPPRALGWQVPRDFPMVEAPFNDARHPAWTVTARESGTHFFHRLSVAHSSRAIDRGFVLFARADPISGLTNFLVDLSPAGSRFDVTLSLSGERTIDVRLLSSVIPREGRVVSLSRAKDHWPLIELRYEPARKAATLFVDGRLVLEGYAGHPQFQDPLGGAVSWAAAGTGDGTSGAAARFNLVWFEIW